MADLQQTFNEILVLLARLGEAVDRPGASVTELNEVVRAMPPPPGTNDDWQYGHGFPTLQQLCEAAEITPVPEDWALFRNYLFELKAKADLVDEFWENLDLEEQVRQLKADLEGALWTLKQKKVELANATVLAEQHAADLKSVGVKLAECEKENGRLQTNFDTLLAEQAAAQAQAEARANKLTMKRYYRITVQECPTPIWRHYVPFRGWIEAGPHEIGISPADPKHQESRWIGSVFNEEGQRIETGFFQRVVKFPLTVADVGKSLIIETADLDSIPSRLGILARGAFVAPGLLYGIPNGNGMDARLEGDDQSGIIKCDMRPPADDLVWNYGDGTIQYERL